MFFYIYYLFIIYIYIYYIYLYIVLLYIMSSTSTSVHTKLLKILEDLILCIEGEWFVGDGALLGLIRENKLIEYDDDIDIYLLPGSKINKQKLNKLQLSYQDYYLCGKVYDKNNDLQKKNKWIEYINYNNHLPINYGCNRAEVAHYATKTYKKNCIKHTFTYPCIDIFYLEEYNDTYILPFYFGQKWCDYIIFTKDLTETMDTYLYNLKIKIPKKYKEVLEIIYGKNWRIPIKDTYKSFSSQSLSLSEQ